MELMIDRAWKKSTYTISRLFIDGARFYETLEDKDRGLRQTDPIYFIRSKKVFGETAIPTGRYEVTLDVVSPKYAAIPWYKNLCAGHMPRLVNVPGFDGILIHPGSTALDSAGCILIGRNTAKGKLTSSRDTFKLFYQKLATAKKKGQKIFITIK